jgi:hypothetical protein
MVGRRAQERHTCTVVCHDKLLKIKFLKFLNGYRFPEKDLKSVASS